MGGPKHNLNCFGEPFKWICALLMLRMPEQLNPGDHYWIHRAIYSCLWAWCTRLEATIRRSTAHHNKKARERGGRLAVHTFKYRGLRLIIGRAMQKIVPFPERADNFIWKLETTTYLDARTTQKSYIEMYLYSEDCLIHKWVRNTQY